MAGVSMTVAGVSATMAFSVSTISNTKMQGQAADKTEPQQHAAASFSNFKCMLAVAGALISFSEFQPYKEYLEHILEYLMSFLYRTEPLQDIEKIFTKLESEFEEQWTNGEVPGWENKGTEKESVLQESAVDLDYYSTVEELVELGPEKLKEALTARGLKGGGTVQQRAERLFLLKHTPLEKLDRKHFAKGDDLKKEIALTEMKMKRLCEILDEVIVRTKENAEKKLTLTYEEMEAEREEEEVQADSESDDEDQQIYNPLKLPMGWDGKPIPYWLYKLHGLGQRAASSLIFVSRSVVEGRPLLKTQFHPWDEEGRGGEALAHGLWGVLSRRAPPVVEGSLAVGRGAGESEPVQHLVPDLPGEGAGKGEVVHGLGGLVAEGASCGVLQATAGEAEFKCEICGNHSYWGRRAYERHFKEWRHQHGMRCLGIPNTKNFNEITSIKDNVCKIFFSGSGSCTL
ncbi:Splicing factor 3A subunit 3 [Triticum urartu]|uniref:Splicing factor 3A subunit 3 n=1 Tax=Triticum urartu TaxID=4572 RepID=M7Z113_TRIUA|nr:Splicing factor 3A subunit 3 [Triticum urartu]